MAPLEHSLPCRDMLAYADIVSAAYLDRSSRLGTFEGEKAALQYGLCLPRSYHGFMCRGAGRIELDVLEECRQATAGDPGLFDCFFHPAGPLRERLELSLGKNPELRELSSFLSKPRSAEQPPHEDNAAATEGNYVTLFFGVQHRVSGAGGTSFFEQSAALPPTKRSAFCKRLIADPRSAACTTIQLELGQYLTFSLHMVHYGKSNLGFDHNRILGSALYARRGAPDLPQNRAHHPLPARSQRQRPTAEARQALLLVREVTAPFHTSSAGC